MNVKLTATARGYLRDGLTMLLAQTKTASREMKKAFLNPEKADTQVDRIEDGLKLCPGEGENPGAEREWEIPQDVMIVYRDAIAILGVATEKIRQRELEIRIDAMETKQRIAELKDVFRILGDQRDFLELLMAEKRDEEKRGGKQRPDPAQRHLSLEGKGKRGGKKGADVDDKGGVDGRGNRPPKAADVDSIAASPAPGPTK